MYGVVSIEVYGLEVITMGAFVNIICSEKFMCEQGDIIFTHSWPIESNEYIYIMTDICYTRSILIVHSN